MRLVGAKQGPRVITIRDSALADRLPVQTPMNLTGMRREQATACKRCGSAIEEVLFTTGGADGSPALWAERPIAVDGFRCTKCGNAMLPRFLEPAEVTALANEGKQHAEAGRLDEAELAFRRVCNSWPGFAPARVNLATLYGARLEAEENGEDRPAVIKRYLDTRAVHLKDALRGDKPPLPLIAGMIIRDLLRSEAEREALELVDELSRSPELSEPDRQPLADLRRFIQFRFDLYERGTKLLNRRIKIHGAPWTPPDDGVRRQMQQGVEFLLRHQRANPSSWQALWVAGKGLQALGDENRAAQELGRAFAIAPTQPDVGREYALTLISLQRFAEAEEICRAASAAAPNDGTLLANLALALLLNKKVEEAESTVQRAVSMDRSDTITAALAQRIVDVRQGRRPQPQTLDELERN